jgi:aspartate/methionine/tyrosine aminotransferase
MAKEDSEYLDLTQHEIHALKHEFNLADAHTHQSQSPTQRKIVESLPKLWYEAEDKMQHEMDEKFIKTFFEVQRQNYALKTPTFLFYAASIAMIAVANHLRRKNLSVSLMEPSFDNIPDIMKNMGVSIKPISEELFHDIDNLYDNLKKSVKTDAIFLIDPNNPTGFTLSGKGKYAKKGFEELVRYAKDNNKLLLLDLCFASFMLPDDELVIFELYELLEKSGVSYIAIEDTGKTWPLQDAKVALLKTSKDLHEEINIIHSSYLLNVSPFILNLVTQYILDSKKDNFASVFNLLDKNREIVKREFKDTILEFQEPKSRVSVAWLKIKDPKINATQLQRIILKKKVYVLPGTYFYWKDHKKGERYIRLALARNTDMFEKAVKKIKEALKEVN